jgi:hypothetical protein
MGFGEDPLEEDLENKETDRNCLPPTAPLYVFRLQLKAVAPAALSVTSVDELLVLDCPT